MIVRAFCIFFDKSVKKLLTNSFLHQCVHEGVLKHLSIYSRPKPLGKIGIQNGVQNGRQNLKIVEKAMYCPKIIINMGINTQNMVLGQF